MLLSGCVGFGEEYTRVDGFSNRDAGAIVLKGTTREPRLGNPAHRVYETPMGMLNAIGLQNPGVEHVVDKILPTLDFSETRFIANVCGSTIDDYVEVTRRFDDSPIDAIEINISCPNIKEGGVQFGNYPDMSARVVEACRKVTSKPLITKLSPNQTDIRENARRCIEAGSDGLAVINTIMGMAIDVKTRRPVIGNVQGGLSGPAIKPIALLKVMQVAEVARPLNVPIIGQGGIFTADDALEFLIAGATTVGVGTALFYDPLVCPKINDGIATYLASTRNDVRCHGADPVARAAETNSSKPPSAETSVVVHQASSRPSSLSLRVSVLRPQPEQPRRFLATAARRLQRFADQRALELRRRIVEERRVHPAARRACAQPASACAQSDDALPSARAATEIRRDVGARDLAASREHGQPATGVDELAHVAGPVERDQRLRASSVSDLGATPSSSAATSR